MKIDELFYFQIILIHFKIASGKESKSGVQENKEVKESATENCN